MIGDFDRLTRRQLVGWKTCFFGRWRPKRKGANKLTFRTIAQGLILREFQLFGIKKPSVYGAFRGLICVIPCYYSLLHGRHAGI